jgi:hypothetical protein
VHIVAARLGDDPNTVLGMYAHLLPQSDEQAAERVAALLARSVSLADGAQTRMAVRGTFNAELMSA